MDLSGINQFGSLTTQSGKKLEFKDFDVNQDGEISKAEFSQVVNNYKLDSLELSSLDSNKDEVVTEDEFALYETKAEMNQELTKFINETVLKDDKLSGTSIEYGQQVANELREWASAYLSELTGNSVDAMEEFKTKLQEKFAEVKDEVLENTPEAINDRVVGDVLEKIVQKEFELLGTPISEDAKSDITYEIGDKLTLLGQKFVESYQGDNLATDLQAYLELALTGTKAEVLADAIKEYENGEIGDSGDYISSTEFAQYKEEVKELLMSAVNSGIILNIEGSNIASEAAINSFLAKYGTDNRKDLAQVMDNLLEQIKSDPSTMKDTVFNNKLEEIEEQETADKLKQEQEFNQKLAEVGIEASLTAIDYSSISGYNANASYKDNGKGCDTDMKNSARALLESSLKENFKNQINKQLENLGVPFEYIENIFENSFNQALNDTVNSCVWYREGKFIFVWRREAGYNVQNLVNTFINNFNKILSTETTKLNASQTDMDINNIDTSVCFTDSEGNVDEGLQEAFETGATYSQKRINENKANKVYEDYKNTAKTMIDRLKSTMFAKANAMCEANGIEFDNDAFETAFNNAKDIAVGTGVTFTGRRGLKRPVSTFNPQTCVNTFLTTFQESYTAWVNSEKTVEE